MRRQFKLGFGGWLAATAVALGQTAPQQPATVQPIRYVTPFATHMPESQAHAVGQSQAVQGAQQMHQMPVARMQQTAQVQYVPMQALANGQYVAVQAVANTAPMQAQPQMPVQPQMQAQPQMQMHAQPQMQMQTAHPTVMTTGGYTPVQPTTSGPAMPTTTTTMTDMTVTPTTNMVATPMPPTMNGASMANAQMNTGAMTMTNAAPMQTQTQTTVQYIPIQPTASSPQAPVTNNQAGVVQYVPVQGAQVQTHAAPVTNMPAEPIGAGSPTAAIVNGNGYANGNGNGNNGCANGTCGIGDACGEGCGRPGGRFWVSGEYLLWWVPGFPVPALVTVADCSCDALPGALGEPHTTVAYGNQDLNGGQASGFRLRAGAWLNCCNTCGIEASYFFLGDLTDDYRAGPSSKYLIARPFTNVRDGYANAFQDAQVLNIPGVESGTIAIDSQTSFTGFDVNIRANRSMDCCNCNRVDWLAGFRYLRLEDWIRFEEQIDCYTCNPGFLTHVSIYEKFRTLNEFYGAQVGMTGEHHRGCMFFNWRALLALGNSRKIVDINGQTCTDVGGACTSYRGGLLAVNSNIGRYTSNEFAVVPEFGANVGYQWCENLRLFVGYSLIYWSNVTRPGDVINTAINSTQLPPGALVGPTSPTFTWTSSDFWAQGINFGAEVKY